MKEPDWKSCSEEQVWEYVAWHLASNGIETILVGGAVAAIYSEGAYKSGDLDFVLKTYVEGKVTTVMEAIGFKQVFATDWPLTSTSVRESVWIKRCSWQKSFRLTIRRSKHGALPKGRPRLMKIS